MLKNKWKWIVSSVLILLPMLLGLIVWDKLPESMPIHWGVDGKADGFGTPLTVVIFMPLLLLVLHWLGLWITAKDNGKNNQSGKVTGMVYWILPLISLLVCGVIYAAAFDYTLHMGAYVALLMGIMFIFMGNYMPKCRPNRTIGIKIKWTLANEENWERTHRVAGKVWVSVGVLLLPLAFLPMTAMLIAMFILVAVGVIIPTVYSYKLYKKLQGTYDQERKDRYVDHDARSDRHTHFQRGNLLYGRRERASGRGFLHGGSNLLQ